MKLREDRDYESHQAERHHQRGLTVHEMGAEYDAEPDGTAPSMVGKLFSQVLKRL